MREELRKKCDEYLKKREMVAEVFAWYNTRLHPVCAGIVLDKADITKEEVIRCKKMIEKKTNIFSEIRGNAFPPIACHLACAEYPEELLEQILKIYKMFRKADVPSGYLPLVAVIIATFGDECDYDRLIEKTRDIYYRMKEAHPILTSGEDSPFAAMLALDIKEPQGIIQEVEKCYEFLKGSFFAKNAVQSLSHVLAMGEGEALDKCRRFMDIYMTFKMKGYKFDSDYYLSVLGAVSLLPFDVNDLVEDVIAVTQFLDKQPGFGMLDSSLKERMAHATVIVSKEYLSKCLGQVLDVPLFSATIAGVTAAIVMQSSAMCAVF
ncbi:MAG: DUF4003 family protein [Lachnospiraceae bacterium]|nr:DUF4003 family protein [Lachnospiraceae bacterium]